MGTPVAPMPGGAGQVDQQKAMLDNLVKQILSRAQQPQQSHMGPPPASSITPDQLQQQGYDMSASQNKPQDIGKALGNFGTFIHNAVAQHKQNQVTDASAVWSNLSRAYENSTLAAGDPSAPDYQQKVNDLMMKDPWVSQNLNPANPKAMKHLKNMQKAFDVNLIGGEDENNVYREGLKHHFKVSDALQKMKLAKGKMDGQKQQATQEQKTQAFQKMLSTFSGMATKTQPDVKQQEEAARLGTALEQARKPDKTLDSAWIDAKTKELGHPPTSQDIEARQAAKTTKPIDAVVAKGIELAESGDLDGAKKQFDLAAQAHNAVKPPTLTTLGTVFKANQGDKASIDALHTYVKMQKEIRSSGAEAYARMRGRYMLHTYVDDTGTPVDMNFDQYEAAKAAGEDLTPTGRVSSGTIVAAQRMKKEALPAFSEVRKYIGAYDNPDDRAIFGRVISLSGEAKPGIEGIWMKHVIDQALQRNLSPDGKKLAVRLRRAADVMGTVRATTNLPATESAMALTVALLPGPSTPDSAMARDMMDQLDAVVNNATDIGMLRKAAPDDKPKTTPAEPGTKTVTPISKLP